MKGVFCSSDTSVRVCPNCGTELAFADYYSAVKGASTVVNQRTDWAERKKYTTVSTQYSDIQKHRGAFCLACYYKKSARRVTIGRIMTIIGFFGTLYTAIHLLGILGYSQDMRYAIPTAVFAVILWFGWQLISDGGLLCKNPYRGITKENIHRIIVSNEKSTQSMLSRYFVDCFPRNQIPSGKVYASLSAFNLND